MGRLARPGAGPDRPLAKGGRRAYIGAVTSALYNRDILRLAASIPHQRRLEQPHGTAETRSPVCGSRVAVDVVLDGEGRITALGQEVKACALGQASAALMGAHAVGRSGPELAEARDALAGFLAGERDDPGEWPGLDLLARARPYKARHPSILLPFEAVAEAAARAVG
jgi:NifU-like protein involved in Fe-S cluster formation